MRSNKVFCLFSTEYKIVQLFFFLKEKLWKALNYLGTTTTILQQNFSWTFGKIIFFSKIFSIRDEVWSYPILLLKEQSTRWTLHWTIYKIVKYVLSACSLMVFRTYKWLMLRINFFVAHIEFFQLCPPGISISRFSLVSAFIDAKKKKTGKIYLSYMRISVKGFSFSKSLTLMSLK